MKQAGSGHRVPFWRGAAAQLVAALVLGACASTATERFYRLDAGAAETALAAYGGDVRVVVVAVPDAIDRPQLVLLRGPDELEVLEGRRWAEPVRSGVARVLIQDLGRTLPQAWVRGDGPARGGRSITVFVHIDVMEATTDGDTRLEARWLVRGGEGEAGVSDRLALRRQAGADPAAIVAAWSGQIEALAGAIARSLATMPAQP